MPKPSLSIVILTLNEEASIGPCLESLARQTRLDFEVLVLDAASKDGTLDLLRKAQKTFPVPLHLHASSRRLDIGEARNLGVANARASRVAFLSADLEVDPRWVEEAMRGLDSHDMVFGRQVHAPHTWTLGAAVRGLRYHYPRGPTTKPLHYASNVSSAYHKRVLTSFPFESWANAAEDLLLARRAHEAGHRAMYNPHMIVEHHDVGTSRAEWRKNVREGRGWALYSKGLGLHKAILAWGLALVATLLLLLAPVSQVPLLSAARLVPFPLMLWLPAIRRGSRRLGAIPARHLLLGILASPAFDLAFLYHYMRTLIFRPASP